MGDEATRNNSSQPFDRMRFAMAIKLNVPEVIYNDRWPSDHRAVLAEFDIVP
jgi:hypothetical protein